VARAFTISELGWWHALSSAWARADTRIDFTRWKARATTPEIGEILSVTS